MNGGDFRLAPVVDALCDANADLMCRRGARLGRHALPSREALVEIVAGLRAAMFPGHFGASDLSNEGIHYYVGHTLDTALVNLKEQMRRGLLFACPHCG